MGCHQEDLLWRLGIKYMELDTVNSTRCCWEWNKEAVIVLTRELSRLTVLFSVF